MQSGQAKIRQLKDEMDWVYFQFTYLHDQCNNEDSRITTNRTPDILMENISIDPPY